MITEIIKSIKKDYLSYISYSSLTSDEKLKEFYLMKRKNEQEFFKPKFNHDITSQKDNTFSIINNSKIENTSQLNASKNIIIGKQSDIINYMVNNSEKLINESSNNLKQEENNKPKIIIDDKEANLINNSSSIKNPSFKMKYFNIEKDLIKKHLLDFKTNNEIRVLKNRKIIYINSDSLNNYSTKRYIKKLKKINFVRKYKTSSKYRGVSRNGNKWQVLIMANNKKYFIGNYPSEELAARIYDIYAIKKKGIKARTNFPYNHTQIKNIYDNNINTKCSKISEILIQINS